MVKNHARKNAAKAKGIKHTAAVRGALAVQSGHRMRVVDGEIEVCSGCLNSGGYNVAWGAAELVHHTLLYVGDRVRLGHDSNVKRWWDVREADERFVVLTRQADFQPKSTLFYTIIDWERGVRGPSNKLGQGWDVESPGGPANLLAALNAHTARVSGVLPLSADSVEVSYRNNVAIEFLAHDSSTRAATTKGAAV